MVAIADKVVILDGHGNITTRDATQDTTSRVALIKELWQAHGVLGENDELQQDGGAKETTSDSKEKTEPNLTKDAKNRERQRGDLGLYRFYFFSSGIWNYLSWLAMVAISMLWGQMPCKYHEPLCSEELAKHSYSDFPSHLAGQGP